MKGKLIVPNGNYMNEYALENVIDYVYDSPYACPEDALYSNVEDISTVNEVIDAFKQTQQYVDMIDYRQVFHLIMTIPVKKNAYAVLQKTSRCIIERLAYEGMQSIIMPHSGSRYDAYNIHAHIVINPIKTDGTRLYDSQDNYKMICNILNDCSRSVQFKLIYK